MNTFPKVVGNQSNPGVAIAARALAFAVVACLSACAGDMQSGRVEAASAKARQDRYAKAKALFDERCKTAGTYISKTIQAVEGVRLAKVRQPIPWSGAEYFNPLYSEAAMAGEHRGDYYLKQFLMDEVRVATRPSERGALVPPTAPLPTGVMKSTKGYRFVEYIDPKDQHLYRCVLVLRQGQHSWEGTPLNCQLTTQSWARHALDYEDIVNPEDRELWVAGTKLKVVDIQTGETIAYMTKFVWDPGFGESSTGRRPWEHAGSAASTVCPSDATRRRGFDSRYFIDNVLVPKQGN